MSRVELLVYFFFQMYVYWLLHSALWFDISWFKLRNFLLRLQLDKLRQWVNELLINTLKRTCLTGYVITSITRFCFDWCLSKNFYHMNSVQHIVYIFQIRFSWVLCKAFTMPISLWEFLSVIFALLVSCWIFYFKISTMSVPLFGILIAC